MPIDIDLGGGISITGPVIPHLVFIDLVEGKKVWEDLSAKEQTSVVSYLGLDPSKKFSKKDFQQAWKAKVGQLKEIDAIDVDTDGYEIPPIPSPPPEEAEKPKRVIEANYKLFLQDLGLPMTGNLSTLVDQARRRGYNSNEFLFYLRQTPEYRERFPGIFNPDGTVKMSEATYLDYENQFKAIAARTGLNIGEGRMTWLFQNNIDPTLYADRAQALRRIKTDPNLRRQFEAVTRAEGNKQNLFRFVMGQGNAEWYREWNTTVARYQAVEAGLRLGEKARGTYTFLPEKIVKEAVKKGLDEATLRQGFEKAAEMFLTTLPASRIQKAGLSKQDITRAIFGGKGSAQVRQKIGRILATEEAFEEPRAVPQTFTTEEGGLGVLGQGRSARKAQTA